MKLLFLALNVIVSCFPAEKVIHAINCGGKEFTGSDGVKYVSDTFYSSGDESEYGANQDIENAQEPAVYQSERINGDDFYYSLPLEGKEGKFTVVLKFVEIFYNAAEERVFDVAIGDTKVIDKLDIYERVGKQTGLDFYLEIEVKGSQVRHEVGL